jgi:3D (Asp-Asp-Asp) domain-containing protein
MLFALIFVSLIVAIFFVYDIVFIAMEVEKQDEVVVAEPEILVQEPEVVREPEKIIVSSDLSFLVNLSADGKYFTFSYKEGDGATVRDLLYRCSIFLNENDVINYSLDTPLTSNIYVEVGRVTYEEKISEVEIPYDTIEIPVIYSVFSGKYKNDDVEGKPGIKEIKKRIKLVEGKVVESKTISEKIIEKPKDAIVYKDKSSLLNLKNGPPKDYLTVIDCEATAYTYVEDGGRKTFTGDKTRVGYIAVDPKVIPLKSKVYVVLDNGFVYGYCEARDIGGAIKGNIVDLFLGILQ